MFVGYSKDHASNVGCVLNVMTKSITPQFHMIYDDFFLTIENHSQDAPPKWETLVEKEEMTLDELDKTPDLADEWLDPTELAKCKHQGQLHIILKHAQQDLMPAKGATPYPMVDTPMPRGKTCQETQFDQEFAVSEGVHDVVKDVPMVHGNPPAEQPLASHMTRGGRVI